MFIPFPSPRTSTILNPGTPLATASANRIVIHRISSLEGIMIPARRHHNWTSPAHARPSIRPDSTFEIKNFSIRLFVRW